MQGVPLQWNVIVFVVPLTWLGSNVPSDDGGSGWFEVASSVSVPPAVICAPPAATAETVGVMLALTLKPTEIRSRPPEMLVPVASESFVLSACAVMLNVARFLQLPPPRVAVIVGVPLAVALLPTSIAAMPPEICSILASAKSTPFASRLIEDAPADVPSVPMMFPRMLAVVLPEDSAVMSAPPLIVSSAPLMFLKLAFALLLDRETTSTAVPARTVALALM